MLGEVGLGMVVLG